MLEVIAGAGGSAESPGTIASTTISEPAPAATAAARPAVSRRSASEPRGGSRFEGAERAARPAPATFAATDDIPWPDEVPPDFDDLPPDYQ
ncbi:hypothetical protein [Nocardia tengchongensis]|uniref:hypothetical protein n=1 Tax=Nocardia tengchongensis TaxID=2055889 RepID=UPI0036A33AB5